MGYEITPCTRVAFRAQAVMKGVTAIAVIAKATYNPTNTGIT